MRLHSARFDKSFLFRPCTGFCIKEVTRKRNNWSLDQSSMATSCSLLWLSSEAWRCWRLILAHPVHRSHNSLISDMLALELFYFHWHSSLGTVTDGFFLSVCMKTGGCTEAAELVGLHRGRHNASWAVQCHPEAVERFWCTGRVRQSCWVPTERLCWLVSAWTWLGVILHIRQLAYSRCRKGFLQGCHILKPNFWTVCLQSTATSMKWTESANQTTSPLSRTCCDLESKQLVSLKNSSPAKSCTSG